MYLGKASHTHYYWDFEFHEDGSRILPISVGIVDDDGREYYAEFECPLVARSLGSRRLDWPEIVHPWVAENVLPHIDGNFRPKHEIRDEIRAFVAAGAKRPMFVGFYGSYDWICLAQLFGKMIDLPRDWPMFFLDIKAVATMRNAALPPQDKSAAKHNALHDARWHKQMWESLHP